MVPVAVVIPSWNSAHEIEAALASAIAQSPAEVVVVDNGSDDGTPALVRARYSEGAVPVRVVALGVNAGFSRACNVGIAQSRAPYVLTLNADARLSPGYLATLCAALDAAPGAASAAGKLVYRDEAGVVRIDSAGISLVRYALRPEDRGLGEEDRGQYDTPGAVFGVSAAAALYRRAALDALGAPPFDEDLFAYYEDVDLAWRLARAGWTHLYVPAARGEHRRRGPDRKPPAIAARAFANRYLVWLKNESPWRFLSYAPVALAWEAARLARRALRQPALLRGLGDAARLAPRMVRRR